MTDTRYFIFNHEAAFNKCGLYGLRWSGDGLCPDSDEGTAVLTVPVLDSGENKNVWRRVLADIEIGGGGCIKWHLRACDSIERQGAWGEEYCAENAADFLPAEVCGRFLSLTAEMSGDVKLRSLRIYRSWESFLDYLPEIYREYNSFLDNFLSLFAAQYFDLEQKIKDFPSTLDPAAAPEKTLRMLAELVNVRHISLWETEGLRRLLTSGIYRRRGQFSVFDEYIEYFTGYKPYIAEHFKYQTGIKQNDRQYENGDVTVFLPPTAAGLDIKALDTVICDFLPGDVICRVVVLDEYPVVSGGAVLGVNTSIGRYETMTAGKARVGITVIGGGT